MNCEPCKNAECLGLPEQEYEALKELYQRIVDTQGCCTDDEDDNTNNEQCQSRNSDHRDIYNLDEVENCSKEKSALKLFDQNLTTLLKQRERITTEHSLAQKNLNKLSTFKSCIGKTGAINAALLSLDIEQEMSHCRVDHQGCMKRAAYELIMAEAYCKHTGAVEAAEIAMHCEPIDSLVEDAARIGAQTFSTTANVGQMSNTDISDSPVEVIAYVGNTYPKKDVN